MEYISRKATQVSFRRGAYEKNEPERICEKVSEYKSISEIEDDMIARLIMSEGE